jgi:hypothetical protein
MVISSCVLLRIKVNCSLRLVHDVLLPQFLMMKLFCSSIRLRDLSLNQSTSSKYVILMMVKLDVENKQHTALVLTRKNDTVYVKVLLRLHLIWKWKPNLMICVVA